MPGFAKVSYSAENHLLSLLPDTDFKRLLPNLQRTSFSSGQVLYEPGSVIEYLYFPTSCVVSLLYTTRDGATAEMGLAGNDGAVGVALYLGGDSTPNRAVVVMAGSALCLKAGALREEFARGGPFQSLMLRY